MTDTPREADGSPIPEDRPLDQTASIGMELEPEANYRLEAACLIGAIILIPTLLAITFGAFVS